jgi:Zn-dependent M28 family amino/carboxypeptidase
MDIRAAIAFADTIGTTVSTFMLLAAAPAPPIGAAACLAPAAPAEPELLVAVVPAAPGSDVVAWGTDSVFEAAALPQPRAAQTSRQLKVTHFHRMIRYALSLRLL